MWLYEYLLQLLNPEPGPMSFHLRDYHQSKRKTKKDQVHAVHPAQEDKVRRYR